MEFSAANRWFGCARQNGRAKLYGNGPTYTLEAKPRLLAFHFSSCNIDLHRRANECNMKLFTAKSIGVLLLLSRVGSHGLRVESKDAARIGRWLQQTGSTESSVINVSAPQSSCV